MSYKQFWSSHFLYPLTRVQDYKIREVKETKHKSLSSSFFLLLSLNPRVKYPTLFEKVTIDQEGKLGQKLGTLSPNINFIFSTMFSSLIGRRSLKCEIFRTFLSDARQPEVSFFLF